MKPISGLNDIIQTDEIEPLDLDHFVTKLTPRLKATILYGAVGDLNGGGGIGTISDQVSESIGRDAFDSFVLRFLKGK